MTLLELAGLNMDSRSGERAGGWAGRQPGRQVVGAKQVYFKQKKKY